MTENRHTIVTSFEAPQTGGAEATLGAPDLSAEQVQVRGKRILLVEDEEPLRTCLRMILEFAGHQVTEASNGAEAWNAFTLGKYDLVITDFEMPVMDGSRLAIGIKLLAPALPILMITASEKARRGPKNPIDILLNKPFTVVELHRAIQQLFLPRLEAVQPVVVRDFCEGHMASEVVGAPVDHVLPQPVER